MYERLSSIKHLEDYEQNDSIYFAESLYGEGRKIPLHAHDFYELALIKEGALVHDYNGIRQNLSAGDLQLIHPLDVHTYESIGSHVSVLLNFAFTETVYKNLCRSIGVEALDKGLARLDTDQVVRYANRINGLENGGTSKFQLLLGLMLDYQFQREGSSDEITAVLIPLWLKKAMNAMVEPDNLRGGLERFIELSGRSKEHLFRVMKRYFDVPAGKWVNEHRLEYARRLVRTTDKNILEIVFEVGFNSESYFYRMYKAYFGVTPSEERKRTCR